MASHGDRYVIVELDGSGHRFWFVSLLIKRLNKNDVLPKILLVTTRVAQDRSEWLEFIEGLLPNPLLDVILVEGPSTTLETIATLPSARNSRLIIPDGDRWLARILLATALRRLRPRGSILIMRPYRGPGMRGVLRHLIKQALLTSIAILARDLRVLRLAPFGSQVTSREWVNDPVEFHPRDVTRQAWYERHGVTSDRRHLVVLGDLTHRKFVHELIDAFDRQLVDNWHLVLVGRLGTTERNYFAARSAPTRVCVVEGFISDQDFDTWVAQADAVAVLYRNEGASGVLAKCSVAGVPVLVGGSRTVLDAARMLDLPRSEILSVNPDSIREALALLPPRTLMTRQGNILASPDEFASRLIHD